MWYKHAKPPSYCRVSAFITGKAETLATLGSSVGDGEKVIQYTLAREHFGPQVQYSVFPGVCVCVCLFICTFSSFALLSCMVETTELQFAMFSSSWLPLFHLIDNLFTDLSSHSPLVISSSAFRISVCCCSSPGTSSNFILTDTLLKAQFTQLVKHSLW